MRAGKNLQDFAKLIADQKRMKQDVILPSNQILAVVQDGTPLLQLLTKPVSQAVLEGDRTDIISSLDINAIAADQLAEYTGIPVGYFKRMAASEPELLARNINTWLEQLGGKRRMVRALANTCRAVLSDGYRKLEHADIVDALLPILLQRGMKIMSCEVTDARLYIKAVDTSIERDVPTGRMMGDGTHTIFDTCCPAVIIQNSEVGMGELAILTGVYTKACTNLALFGDQAFRKRHTGTRHKAVGDDSYSVLSDETRALTDAALWSQCRDLVHAGLDEAKFEARCKQLGDASKDKIPAVDATVVIERASDKLGFGESESAGILGALIEGGDLSRYGLHSAITRYSQSDKINYDRSTELERAGAKVIEFGTKEWADLIRVAA